MEPTYGEASAWSERCRVGGISKARDLSVEEGEGACGAMDMEK
jgi:hypothetical protein